MQSNTINTIYLPTSPSGKIYIGQTTNLKRRLRAHKNSPKRKDVGCPALTPAIKKYGWESFTIDILFEGTDNLLPLDYSEKYFINLYKSNQPHRGYNLTTGGQLSEGYSAKKVYQYDRQGNYIACYSSLDKAGKAINRRAETVSRAAKGIISTAGVIFLALPH
jgi:hypothetical protein